MYNVGNRFPQTTVDGGLVLLNNDVKASRDRNTFSDFEFYFIPSVWKFNVFFSLVPKSLQGNLLSIYKTDFEGLVDKSVNHFSCHLTTYNKKVNVEEYIMPGGGGDITELKIVSNCIICLFTQRSKRILDN